MCTARLLTMGVYVCVCVCVCVHGGISRVCVCLGMCVCPGGVSGVCVQEGCVSGGYVLDPEADTPPVP